MKHFYLLAVAALFSIVATAQTPCVDGMAGNYPCDNVDLMGFLSLDDMGNGDNTNDVWGWTSPETGREYALVGCANGTAFVEVTEPTDPVFIGFLETHTVPSLWRDIKTYNNFAFIVSEAPAHGLQVFELAQLDDVVNPPVYFDETAHYDGFGNAHNVAINPDSPYAYVIGSNTFSGGLHIVDITDPLNPTLAGGFSQDGYTHDCQAVFYDGPDPDYQGREIVVACNEDAVTVVDVTDKSDCDLVSVTGYNGSEYTHQGWFAKGMKYFLFDDELDEMQLGVGTRTHIMDMSDLDNPEYIGFYESQSSAIDHNLYTIDQFVYLSNYRSGLRIYDAAKVSQGTLSQVGFFDLYPNNDNAQFSGSWSNYAWFPSHTIVATDMYSGLFVLRPTVATLSQEAWSVCGEDEITFAVDINATLTSELNATITGLGNSITVTAPANIETPSEFTVTIGNLTSLSAGDYPAVLMLNTSFGEAYEFPIHISISGGAPVQPVLTSPSEGQLINEGEAITFTWEEQTNAASYLFELATDMGFTNIVESEVVFTNSYDLPSTLPLGSYHWRVKATNDCGEGPFSTMSHFDVIFVGIGENSTSEILVYPNPTVDNLFIQSAEKLGLIEVFDVAGRKVLSTNAGVKKTYTLNVAMLEKGNYTLRSESGLQTTFVVVK